MTRMKPSDADFKRLIANLDRYKPLSIVSAPTPVRRLSTLDPQRDLWLKDDSLTHSVYGGNKPRKLEYLLAEARSTSQEVITFGFESSNHALATAYHCSMLGISCHLVLVRGPDGMSESDQRLTKHKVEMLREFATSIKFVDSFVGAAWSGFTKKAFGLGRFFIIPPGGSNALGTLGYVRAGLELAKQIELGELSEPESIFLPLGTGGTATGLAIGIAAAGLSSRIRAVKVVPGPVNERARLKRLARAVQKMLPTFDANCFQLDNLELEREALGAGYAQPTPESIKAVETCFRLEGIKTENTYTGKAAALVLQDTNTSSALFWLTYSEFNSR